MKNLIILRLLFYSVIFYLREIELHSFQIKRRKFKAIKKTGVNKKSQNRRET